MKYDKAILVALENPLDLGQIAFMMPEIAFLFTGLEI
jgi:hypothetical protein